MAVWAKGARFSPMTDFAQTLRTYRPGPAAQLTVLLALLLALVLLVIGPARLLAQIEGERGIPPIAGTSDIQIGGIEVNVTGKDAQDARFAGWKLAQSKAWEKLGGPKMSDEQIDAMVSAIVIEQEQIGPRRYIARLGVIFDRAKAGQFIAAPGEATVQARSAALLVIPVFYSGGASQVFEVRGEWQKAWAGFQPGSSAIDYVRPVGSGGDSLLLTAGQPGRRSRIWWRNVLDQFGAADVIMPVARLERQWPGGPVHGTFTARHGPDNTFIASFRLNAANEEGVPAMLSQALVRLDAIYNDALARGMLRPDPTLASDQNALNAAFAALRSQLAVGNASGASPDVAAAAGAAPGVEAPQKPETVITVQFASPDANAVDAALSAVRGVPGVQSAATSSLAIGGTSVMRVTMAGDIDALAAALRARGWQVVVGNGALSIRR